jgi:hypothetical protein
VTNGPPQSEEGWFEAVAVRPGSGALNKIMRPGHSSPMSGVRRT